MDLPREVGRMPESTGALRLRRELGHALRRIREERGMTIAEVTTAMKERYGSSFSITKLSRMETARRSVIPRDVHDLCMIYEVPDDERERLVELAKLAHDSGSPVTLDKQLSGYLLYVALEEIASGIREFASSFVPGLLQTPGYARVVEGLQFIAPEYYSPYSEIEDVPRNADDRVKLRLKRQELLDQEDAVSFHVLIDESVLRRRLPDKETMRDQLQHLITISQKPHVTIQVIPFEAGLYPGSETAQWLILDYTDSTDQASTTVYMETANGAQIIEREADVSRMAGTFEALTHLALDPHATRALLESILAGLV
jgi:transcriptional regulator with XRE-family HTH domain